MIGLVRAVTLCATLALGLSAALAADKAFKRDDLADSAIKTDHNGLRKSRRTPREHEMRGKVTD